MNKHIWLIGAGQMAVDYYKVIKDQKVSDLEKEKLAAKILEQGMN